MQCKNDDVTVIIQNVFKAGYTIDYQKLEKGPIV